MGTDFLSNYSPIEPFAAAITHGSKHTVHCRSSEIEVACALTQAQESVNLLRSDDCGNWPDPVLATDEAVASKKVAA